MRAHVREFRLVAMCRVLGVHRSGYYAWLRNGPSAREREDQRLLGLIKHHWLASGAVYGYRKILLDMKEAGESCSRHRVHRLMKAEGLRAQVGYGGTPRHRGGPIGLVNNVLNRDFAPEAPNQVWVTDITYIRTYEGWLFLAVVVDLYSRQVVGWATAPTMTRDLVLQALLAAVWKRKPAPGVLVHSDQGRGSTPKPRTVVKGWKTSDPAWRLFAASSGCGTARCIRTHQPLLHRVSGMSCGRPARA